jgi:hypothetical protein
MNITTTKLTDIKSNPNNPRIIKDDKFKKLVASIKEFPQMLSLRPIVVNDDMIVLGGNMRLKACKEAGLKEVPVIKASELDVDQQRQFIIKDNVGYGEWDWDMLANEWDEKELDMWGLDVWQPDNVIDGDGELDDDYSQKIGEVVYEPKNTNHKAEDLFLRDDRFDNEISLIKNESIRELFKARVSFFYSFHYSKIADYYAYQATDEEKALFEKLALVLLDKNQLIENGFSDLVNELETKEYE